MLLCLGLGLFLRLQLLLLGLFPLLLLELVLRELFLGLEGFLLGWLLLACGRSRRPGPQSERCHAGRDTNG